MNPIAEAASVILTRGPGSAELYLVQRSERLRFYGGYFAFPGGKVAPTDAEIPVHVPTGPTRDPRRVAAVRELFEETGVLLARRADGSFLSAGPLLETLRTELSAGRLAFVDLLAQKELRLQAGDLTLIGDLVTPPFLAMRFDTSFYVAHLPPGQDAVIVPGELARGLWTTSGDFLAAWTRGEHLVSPPTLTLLEAIREDVGEALPARYAPQLAALAAGAIPTIFCSPGVRMLPLFCVGLPPGDYTNAYLVGTGPVYLLDPGPIDAGEQERLFAVLDVEQRIGSPLTAVVLTHHHPDHVGAAARCAERYRVPILAHPRTAELLRGQVAVAGLINDGDRLPLGRRPDGAGDWHLEALHTPGHAGGHLAFYEPAYRLLFAGDMISMLSSVVIAPPDGDLAQYLESLRRLQTLDVRLLLPAHGNASPRAGEVLAQALAHRAQREEQLLEQLGAEPRTVEELAQALYQGLPENLFLLARWQLLAGLRKLEREGRAARSEGGSEPGWIRIVAFR